MKIYYRNFKMCMKYKNLKFSYLRLITYRNQQLLNKNVFLEWQKKIRKGNEFIENNLLLVKLLLIKLNG